MDSQRQEFWKEAIVKEKLLRLNWFRDNWTKYPKTLKKVTEKIKVTLPQIAEPHRESKCKKQAVKESSQGRRSNENDQNNIMRPVSGDTRNVLYDGFSKDETGRYKYLILRKQRNPEDKYLYPITSNLQYGWGLGDMNKAYVSVHALNAIVRESFFRKNGVFSRTLSSDMVA